MLRGRSDALCALFDVPRFDSALALASSTLTSARSRRKKRDTARPQPPPTLLPPQLTHSHQLHRNLAEIFVCSWPGCAVCTVCGSTHSVLRFFFLRSRGIRCALRLRLRPRCANVPGRRARLHRHRELLVVASARCAAARPTRAARGRSSCLPLLWLQHSPSACCAALRPGHSYEARRRTALTPPSSTRQTLCSACRCSAPPHSHRLRCRRRRPRRDTSTRRSASQRR